MFGKKKEQIPDYDYLKSSIIEYIDKAINGKPGSEEFEGKVRFQRKLDYNEINKSYFDWERSNADKMSFSALVLHIMQIKKFSASKLYKKAGLDRKLFSRLKNDYMYQPSKITAIKFCLGLELDIKDSEKMLEKAGYSLSKSQSFDLIIRYCIEHRYYEIKTVNEILRLMDEKEI